MSEKKKGNGKMLKCNSEWEQSASTKFGFLKKNFNEA